MNSYIRLLIFIKEIKKETLGRVLIGLAIVGAGLLQAYFIAAGITAALESQGNHQVLLYVADVAAAVGVRAVLLRFQEGYIKKTAARVKGVIRNKMIEKLMLLGPGYLNEKRSGAVQSLLTDGVESFETFLASYVPQVVIVAVSVTAVIAYLVTLDPVIGVIILVMAFLAIVIPHFFMPLISKIMIEYWQSYAYLNAQYIDAMQGMSTLKAFHASRRMGKQLADDAHVFAKESIDNTGLSLADSALIIFCTAVGTSLSVALAAWHMSEGLISSQALLTILFFAGESMKPLYELNNYWHGSYLGFSVAEELFQLLDEPVPLASEDSGKGFPAGFSCPRVSFEEVSFRYPKTPQDVLHRVTLEIQPGEMTAIVGKSGGGKSTMVNLLLRFYDPDAGAIKIDGENIKSFSLSALRNQIAVVFQDTYLFYGSIEENLRMAKPEAKKEELIAAAKAANAHEFIMGFPDGYQTIVGERGATLSGGERQRIAIARGILKDSPILILDEATASVDMASEKKIQEALERLMKARTTIVIAHRLSTIENAKKIFVLKDGVVEGSGTHEELLKCNATYANLIRAQKNIGSSL